MNDSPINFTRENTVTGLVPEVFEESFHLTYADPVFV